MNWTKLALGTVVGGILYFFLGWLIWGILLKDAMTMPEGMRELIEYKPEEMKMELMAASCLIWALFMTWILLKLGNTTFQSGATNGAIIGLLLGLTYGLSFASMYKFGSLNNTLIDSVANLVANGIMGGIIAWILGRK